MKRKHKRKKPTIFDRALNLSIVLGLMIILINFFNTVKASTDELDNIETSEKKEHTVATFESANKEKESMLCDSDISLIALCTMAEAEGECEEGQRLVIDTILNRVDSEWFPDTVEDVIYQPRQFTSMWNGRVTKCEVQPDICRLVRNELKSRTNSDVIFFRTGKFSEYGRPLFKVGHHYFSSYDGKE